MRQLRLDPRARRVSQLSFETPGASSGIARVLLWSDGASRGNPGPSSIGVVIRDGSDALDSPILATISEYIGETTNNVAEYRAAIAGLDRALVLGARTVELRADSLLVINQLLGRWKVKQDHLVPLHREGRRLLAQFSATQLIHIPREENTDADALANEALDAQRLGQS